MMLNSNRSLDRNRKLCEVHLSNELILWFLRSISSLNKTQNQRMFHFIFQSYATLSRGGNKSIITCSPISQPLPLEDVQMILEYTHIRDSWPNMHFDFALRDPNCKTLAKTVVHGIQSTVQDMWQVVHWGDLFVFMWSFQ